MEKSGFYYTLSVIGGKYKMTIMYLLAEHKVLRHNEIHRYLESVSYKTLSVMLKELMHSDLKHDVRLGRTEPEDLLLL